MDAFVFQFDAKRLRTIPRDYIGFLVASGHCCNELAILLPYIIYEHDLTRANDFETAFILTRKFTIDRILISKIFEYAARNSSSATRAPPTHSSQSWPKCSTR